MTPLSRTAGPPAPSSQPAALVPPRPNPGPEPLGPPSLPWPWLLVGVAVVLGVVAWRVFGRPGRSRTPAPGSEPPAPVPETPRARIGALSARVRAALAARFGEPWLARTTEEIAGSPELAAALGAAEAGRLVAFLGAADRVKFATDDAGAQRLERGELAAWATAFAAAGARCTITGK